MLMKQHMYKVTEKQANTENTKTKRTGQNYKNVSSSHKAQWAMMNFGHSATSKMGPNPIKKIK
jgi:hypothetical protein